MTKKIALLLTVVLLTLIQTVGWGQQNIIPPAQQVHSSFAIMVDEATYQACKAEVDAYKKSLEADGLATYVVSAKWESPEHVKFFLQKYYQEQALEGAVFIGEVPIPMIRGAQHLTSAFKMDEKKFPFRDSSVPSDRFYDDFNLKFDFISKDSLNGLFYYYRLRGDSPQQIACNIYTGRIKPTRKGEAGYVQIREYLQKVVRERSLNNPLDKLCSYTGHGSFSNSLSAWKDEAVTLREQTPAAFKNAQDARFYLFAMHPYMKETLSKELQREELDLMLFHEHGMPHRQYLTGTPPAVAEDELFEAGKRSVRRQLRRLADAGKDLAAYKKEFSTRYGVDSSWFAGAFDPKVKEADSLENLRQGIVLKDIPVIKPNPRMVIFDACYNADFREDAFIAGEYLFTSGKTVVCWGNSVNVLQDKSSSDLLGMLACGARVGEWAKNVNILESHIIGDPAFRFATPAKMPNIRYHSKDTTYWMSVLGHNLPPDLKGLALHKLHQLKHPQMPEILKEVFTQSGSYMLRLQCLYLAAWYGGELYADLLKKGATDPYEFIRRKSAYYMGKTGRNDFIPYLADLYLNDYLSERVLFNVQNVSGIINGELLKKALKDKLDKEDYIFGKEAFYKNAAERIDRETRLRNSFWGEILDASLPVKTRLFSISVLRNNPYSQLVDDLLILLANEKEPLEIRVAIAEALGWYGNSVRNREIIAGCKQVLRSGKEIHPTLKDEMTKTMNRLKLHTGQEAEVWVD